MKPPIHTTTPIWGIHAGKTGDAASLFLSKNCVAGEYGLFFTLGTYSPQCRNFEQSKANLRLIDGDELVDLIFQQYEKFDSRYRSVLPLRRIYVPELIEDAAE